MLQFYFDHNMPPAIARGLQRRHVNVLIAQDDGAASWPDDDILARATELERVVCTQDRDYLRIADEWCAREQDFAGIVYLKPLAITIGRAVDELEMIAKVMTPEDLRNRVYYVPL